MKYLFRIHLSILVILALFASLVSVLSFSVQQAKAVGGDGASSSIDLLDTDADGYINRITFDIANPNGETWALTGSSPYGLSVTQGGNAITISSVSLATGATANPVTIQIDLDTTDTDLVQDTNGVSTNAFELIYTQETGDQTCSTACIQDSTDEELNSIATGDSGATDTEADAANPVITSFTYQDSDGDYYVDRFTVAFSETVTAASVLGANDLTLTNVGDFYGAAFGTDATDLITGSVSSVAVDLGTESTAVDTTEESGNIAISSQNAFSITDGTNTNSTLGAQSQATFIDGAADAGKSQQFLEQQQSDQQQEGSSDVEEEEEVVDDSEQTMEQSDDVEEEVMDDSDLQEETSHLPVNDDVFEGALVKSPESDSVYYIGKTMRCPFLNGAIYNTWYSDFDDVTELTSSEFNAYQLSSPVSYKPGSLLKTPSDPHVYVVVDHNKLRHLASEEVAEGYFGGTWALQVYDIPESWFSFYEIGDPVNSVGANIIESSDDSPMCS